MIVALAEEAHEIENAQRRRLHPELLAVRTGSENHEAQIRMPRRQHRHGADGRRSAAARCGIVNTDDVPEAYRISVLGRSVVAALGISRRVDSEHRDYRCARFAAELRRLRVILVGKQIGRRSEPGGELSGEAHLENATGGSSSHDRATAPKPARHRRYQMFSLGRDEDNVRVPTPKQLSQPRPGGEPETFGLVLNNLEGRDLALTCRISSLFRRSRGDA